MPPLPISSITTLTKCGFCQKFRAESDVRNFSGGWAEIANSLISLLRSNVGERPPAYRRKNAHQSDMTLRHCQRLERGVAKNPTLTSLLAVAAALGVPLETLIEEARSA
jgi:hypothetical protein